MIEKIYRILEIPFVYKLSQLLIVPGSRHLTPLLHERVFQQQTGRVLDVGCGPSLNTPEPEGLIVGVDVNPAYIKKYTGGFLDEDPLLISQPPKARKRLGYVASAERLPFPEGSFDEARTNAIFHHLPREVALKAVQEMRRCVRPGGRVVILDAVWPKKIWKRPLAWLTLRLDRGKFIRSQEEMLRIAEEACPGPWRWERRTVTYTGMEFLCLQWTKP